MVQAVSYAAHLDAEALRRNRLLWLQTPLSVGIGALTGYGYWKYWPTSRAIRDFGTLCQTVEKTLPMLKRGDWAKSLNSDAVPLTGQLAWALECGTEPLHSNALFSKLKAAYPASPYHAELGQALQRYALCYQRLILNRYGLKQLATFKPITKLLGMGESALQKRIQQHPRQFIQKLLGKAVTDPARYDIHVFHKLFQNLRQYSENMGTFIGIIIAASLFDALMMVYHRKHHGGSPAL